MYIPFLILFAVISLSLVTISYAEPMKCLNCVQIPPYEIDLYKEMFPLTVWTNSLVYDHHSTIKVSGYLKPQNTVAPILVVVTNPVGNVVTVQQFVSEGDGNFSFDLNTSGPLWSQNGEYVLKVQSGAETRQFKTKFTLVSSLAGDLDRCGANEISTMGKTGRVYCIPYQISDGVLNSKKGTLNSDSKTLTLELKGHDIKSITFEIPRYVFDSKSPDNDDSVFTVMSNGKVVQYKELTSDSVSRHIQIDYPSSGKATFEIVGTHAIPEFGSIAVLILVIAIMSILIVNKSTSNRLVKF